MNIKIVGVKQKILRNKDSAVNATMYCFYQLALHLYSEVISDHRMLYSVKPWYKTKLLKKEHVAKAVINLALALMSDECQHPAIKDDKYLTFLDELLCDVKVIKLGKNSIIAKNNAITEKIVELVGSLVSQIIIDIEADNKLYLMVINKFSNIAEYDKPIRLIELEQKIAELNLYSGAFLTKPAIMSDLLRAKSDLAKFTEIPSNIEKLNESRLMAGAAHKARLKRFIRFLLEVSRLDFYSEDGFVVYEHNGFLFKIKESENKYDFDKYSIEEVETSGFNCEATLDAIYWFLDALARNKTA